MTRETFADAGNWIALLSPDDDLHPSAVRLSEEPGDASLVTTDAVLGEVLAFFSGTRANSRQAAAGLARDCLANEGVETIPTDRALSLEALLLYERRPDKGYSQVECTSFIVMRARGISAALTPDHHYAQEGFAVLMRR